VPENKRELSIIEKKNISVSRAPLLIPLLIVVLVSFGLFLPMLLQGKSIFWGTPILQFVPWRSWAFQQILDGHLPLWNPLLGMGAPLLANYQSALIYPFNWLLLPFQKFGGAPYLAYGQTILVPLHLAISGVGMMFLLNRLKVSQFGQVIGGLAFALSGYSVSRVGFLSINSALAWMPWVIWSLTPREVNGSLRILKGWDFIFLVVILSMQLLSGHAQTIYYTLLLGGLYIGFWAWQKAKRHDLKVKTSIISFIRVLIVIGGKFLLGILLSAGISAVQLLPTAEYLLQSQRSNAVGFEFAINYSFWPWHLLTLLTPDMFGNPAQGNYWGYANYWEDAIYIGVFPLFLALIGIYMSVTKKESYGGDNNVLNQETLIFGRYALVKYLLLLSSIAFVFALGKNTPVYPWLYFHIPTVSIFQAPTRISIIIVFSLSIMAAIGVDNWHRPTGRTLYWVRLGTVGAVAILIGAGLAAIIFREIKPTFVSATAISGFWVMMFGLSTIKAPRHMEKNPFQFGKANLGEQLRKNLWYFVVLGLIIVDLVSVGIKINPSISIGIYGEKKQNQWLKSKLLDDRRLFIPASDLYDITYQRFFLFNTYDPGESWENLRSTFLPNISMLDKVNSVNNFDPFVPGRYAEWMRLLNKLDPSKREKILRLMNVGMVETTSRIEETSKNFKEIEGSFHAFWVPCSVNVSNEQEALKELQKNDLTQVAIIEFEMQDGGLSCANYILDSRDNLTTNKDLLKQEEIDEKEINEEKNFDIIEKESSEKFRRIDVMTYDDPNQISLLVNQDVDGWLVVSDVYYPGWKAFVDCHEQTVFRADYLFRAVKVTSGKHKILFQYSPLSIKTGSLFTIFSLIIFGGVIYSLLGKNRKS
jgi:hypothetical protein